MLLTLIAVAGAMHVISCLTQLLITRTVWVATRNDSSKRIDRGIHGCDGVEDTEVHDACFEAKGSCIGCFRLHQSLVFVQVCDEMQKTLEMCEFVYYWSREGWCLELLEELRGGFS